MSVTNLIQSDVVKFAKFNGMTIHTGANMREIMPEK